LYGSGSLPAGAAVSVLFARAAHQFVFGAEDLFLEGLDGLEGVHVDIEGHGAAAEHVRVFAAGVLDAEGDALVEDVAREPNDQDRGHDNDQTDHGRNRHRGTDIRKDDERADQPDEDRQEQESIGKSSAHRRAGDVFQVYDHVHPALGHVGPARGVEIEAFVRDVGVVSEQALLADDVGDVAVFQREADLFVIVHKRRFRRRNILRGGSFLRRF